MHKVMTNILILEKNPLDLKVKYGIAIKIMINEVRVPRTVVKTIIGIMERNSL